MEGSGYSRSEAQARALLEYWLHQPGQAGLQGALSSGVGALTSLTLERLFGENRAPAGEEGWTEAIEAGWADEDGPGTGRAGEPESVDISGENDIIIGRSVDAKGKNYEILLPDGSIVEFVEGSGLTGVKTIAGRGRERKIDQVAYLVETFGGTDELWEKRKGFGQIILDGEVYNAELHWYYEPTVDKVLFKVPVDADGNWKVW